MILVEVMVPSLERRYDFELEETVTLDVLIQEMIGAIMQEEHCQCFGEGDQALQLYSQASERRLPMDGTLHRCGVVNGQCLILV